MPHSRPEKNTDVLCVPCIAPNTNLKTAGFNDPLFAYAGRYVDSVNTRNVQNIGIRTVRAQKVRVNYARKRIFVKYGEAVAAFPIDFFLTNIANVKLWGVGVMKTGGSVNRYGDPVEIVAKPSTFFYAEAKGSGWKVAPQDVQVVLSDFDSDDTGNVFAGTFWWGWGIAWDQNDFPDTRQMEFRAQVADAPIVSDSVIYLKPDKPYAVISASGVVSAKSISLLTYDVSNTAAPVLRGSRNGKPNGIITWAKHDAGKRLAVVNSDGKLRIHDYAAFIKDGAAPLIELTPTGKKMFRDLKFDENGTLWVVEVDPKSAPAAGNKLWQVAPSGKSYTATQLDVYGPGGFAPDRIAARKGWIAVGGRTAAGTELRLYRVAASKVQPADTKNFFYRYYHDKTPPAGFCSAATYNPTYCSLDSLEMLDWNGKLYLLYSANGLGDVYELKG